jgi:hypothetical protein
MLMKQLRDEKLKIHPMVWDAREGISGVQEVKFGKR